MGNIFLINDVEAIKGFQNPTKENYNNVGEPNQEFLSKDSQATRSTWDYDRPITEALNSTLSVIDEEENYEDEEIDRYDIELPKGYQEIELYDNQKTFDENFEKGNDVKYILIKVDKHKKFLVSDYATVMPTPQSKCIIDIEKVEEYSSLEVIPIDYETLFGLRLLSFMRYKSSFFLCDERVMFEALLIKYQRFGFKPFYWSKEEIFNEVGIKKDRSTKILDKLIGLGILKKELKRSFINNRPMQINYYELNADRIIELMPEIYDETDRVHLEAEIKKYLFPALKK